MKKLFLITVLLFSIMSSHTYAATLSWVKTPGRADTTGSTPTELTGTYSTGWSGTRLFQGRWVFNVASASSSLVDTIIKVSEQVDSIFDIKVTIDNVLLTFDNAGNWFFDGPLSTGKHVLLLSGSYSAPKNTKGNFDIDISAVPIPAALWLFGSVLFGFMGFRNNKSRSTASLVA